MNDTMRDSGHIPSRLNFGTIPRFPIFNSDLPQQKKKSVENTKWLNKLSHCETQNTQTDVEKYTTSGSWKL